MAGDRRIAVLTGDIVDSSRLQGVNSQPISELIEQTGGWIKECFRPAVHAQIDVFRGDSWQMAVLDPGRAVRIGLYFRALLRATYGMDTRVSIGFGTVDFLPFENISTGTGESFTLSGQGLEKCPKTARMNLSFPPLERSLDGQGLNTVIRLIDLQVRDWTAGQSQAVAGALIGLTQVEIAASWQPEPISQQAISQHLEKAGWIQIKEALDYLEIALPAALARGGTKQRDSNLKIQV